MCVCSSAQQQKRRGYNPVITWVSNAAIIYLYCVYNNVTDMKWVWRQRFLHCWRTRCSAATSWQVWVTSFIYASFTGSPVEEQSPQVLFLNAYVEQAQLFSQKPDRGTQQGVKANQKRSAKLSIKQCMTSFKVSLLFRCRAELTFSRSLQCTSTRMKSVNCAIKTSIKALPFVYRKYSFLARWCKMFHRRE